MDSDPCQNFEPRRKTGPVAAFCSHCGQHRDKHPRKAGQPSSPSNQSSPSPSQSANEDSSPAKTRNYAYPYGATATNPYAYSGYNSYGSGSYNQSYSGNSPSYNNQSYGGSPSYAQQPPQQSYSQPAPAASSNNYALEEELKQLKVEYVKMQKRVQELEAKVQSLTAAQAKTNSYANPYPSPYNPPITSSNLPPAPKPANNSVVVPAPAVAPQASSSNKRALVIGIDYVGVKGVELKGCVRDAENVLNFLKQRGFNDFRILADRPMKMYTSTATPTKSNIIEGLKWLVGGSKPGDTIFIHYSGHGGGVADASGDEADKQDEALYPADYQTAGFLLDDDMNQIIRKLPQGVRLKCLFDCCHSGTILDLPSSRSIGEVLEPVEVKVGGFKGQNLVGTRDVSNDWKNSGEIVMISGCKDDQVSADTAKGGAMSQAFLNALQQNERPTLVGLIDNMRVFIKKGGFSQYPVLSFAPEGLDVNSTFYEL